MRAKAFRNSFQLLEMNYVFLSLTTTPSLQKGYAHSVKGGLFSSCHKDSHFQGCNTRKELSYRLDLRFSPLKYAILHYATLDTRFTQCEGTCKGFRPACTSPPEVQVSGLNFAFHAPSQGAVFIIRTLFIKLSQHRPPTQSSSPPIGHILL